MNIEKFLRTLFFIEDLRWLLLKLSLPFHPFRTDVSLYFNPFSPFSGGIEAAEYCKLFHDGGPNHIETGPLICFVNQCTGFYMIVISFMKELTLFMPGGYK